MSSKSGDRKSGFITRRRFLGSGSGCALGGLLLGPVGPAVAQPKADASAAESRVKPEGFPRQSPKLVQDTVGASHGRFERVRELVTAYPELAKASWDWGFGDWESPIEAASHTGQREIALFLMEHGARPNLFTFAMFGNLGAVKAILEGLPQQAKCLGPHGLSLLHHAKVGGDQAAEVLRFLEGQGHADAAPSPTPKELADSLVGRFTARDGDGPKFEVLYKKERLVLQGEDGLARNLTQLPDGAFHPSGAPSVRFRFDVVGGIAQSASVSMGGETFNVIRAS